METPVVQESKSGAGLRVERLTKHFGPVTAVREVSLAIPAGSFVTLLGPSGSGKTTTLNLIAGFLAPDAGEIFIDTQAISHGPPHKRDIGMVFQNYALFPHMTVFENVAFALRMRSELTFPGTSVGALRRYTASSSVRASRTAIPASRAAEAR